LYNLIIGLFTTSKHLAKHAVTIQYPEEKRTDIPERSRGLVVLLSDKETGQLNCTVCMLCQRACPCGAITIKEHRDEQTKKRVLDDFIVDHTICCFCGICEETCNFAGIKLATYYENSTFTKDELIEHKDELQKRGLDVPYEKPVKKKPAAKKPAAKPADKKPADKLEAKAEVKKETPPLAPEEAGDKPDKEITAPDTGPEDEKEKPSTDTKPAETPETKDNDRSEEKT
jgi:NADH-quinone oxidoreductase subunit I